MEQFYGHMQIDEFVSTFWNIKEHVIKYLGFL